MPLKPFAFFDLDGTLLPWDSQCLFGDYVLRRHPWRRIYLLPVLAALPLRAAGLVKSRFIKRLFLGFLAGLSRQEVEALSEGFARELADRWIWPAMREEIEARRREGCVLVLNTASPDLYAEPLAKILGFAHCVATEMSVPHGLRMPWPPQFTGPNNKREAKITAMRDRGLLKPDSALPLPGAWAYTDSVADLPLLDCAEHGVLVHPRPEMAALARERGWTILEPTPPVSRARRIAAGLGMILGCGPRPKAGAEFGVEDSGGGSNVGG